MLADDPAYVIGVDTHAKTHTLAVVEADSRRCRQITTIPASRQGYRQALRLARRQAPGGRVWASEGTGSYGAGLARFLSDRGERVLEVERPRREGRRGRLKSDALDAERAARQVLSGESGGLPRLGSQTQALRALLVARESAVVERTAVVNQLRALVLTAPAELRERLEGRSQKQLVEACSRLRGGHDSERAALSLALGSLARRARHLQTEADTLQTELHRRVQALAPRLLARRGVGPISAAWLLVAWSTPGRVRCEAAFARLAGVAPIPASSGKTVRYRLDRGGDRRLNRALHTIALSLRRTDPPTQAYIARRVSEGKTEREATRCLKRYLARSIYRALETTAKT
jgi:transposase